mgnify:CR=1 FL=1
MTLRVGIGGIQAERVATIGELGVLLAPLAVGTREMGSPCELLGHHLELHRLLSGPRGVVDRTGPEGNRQADQQHAFDDSDTDLEVGRRMAAGAHIIGLGIGRPIETEHDKQEISDPTHEQRPHQQVDVQDQFIDALAMGRGGLGHSEVLK